MRILLSRYFLFILNLVLITCLSGCFTGIENTKKITEKDLDKLGIKDELISHSEIDTIRGALFRNWTKGKKFYISDNQVRLIFKSNDTLNLCRGNVLQFDSYYEENIYGNSPDICIVFKDSKGNKYSYNTSKTLVELNNMNRPIVIPFLIDMDVVSWSDKFLRGKELFLNNSVWYNKKEEIIKGVKYVKVKILSVEPGNKIYSLKVNFSYDNSVSSVFVSTLDDSVVDRTFDNLFSFDDPHDKYPNITNENWSLIQKGLVVDGMTKEECRLSLGSPYNVDKVPTYNGLQELWQYNDGKYLVFFDGLLVNYRK